MHKAKKLFVLFLVKVADMICIFLKYLILRYTQLLTPILILVIKVWQKSIPTLLCLKNAVKSILFPRRIKNSTSAFLDNASLLNMSSASLNALKPSLSATEIAERDFVCVLILLPVSVILSAKLISEEVYCSSCRSNKV
jgi:hypothetical protein